MKAATGLGLRFYFMVAELNPLQMIRQYFCHQQSFSLIPRHLPTFQTNFRLASDGAVQFYDSLLTWEDAFFKLYGFNLLKCRLLQEAYWKLKIKQ